MTVETMLDLAATDAADLRLVVADLDGTLLDETGRLPDAFWPVLARLRERGIAFAPASGRQYASLARVFEDSDLLTTYIAENGGYVVHDGSELTVATLPAPLVTEVVERVRGARAVGDDVGLVLCQGRCAYVERDDDRFLQRVRPYYAALELVDNLLEVAGEPVKLAAFSFGDAESLLAPALSGIPSDHRLVVSGLNWVDVMPAGVDKGVAVRLLQEELDITPAQTAAFGDYLNDLEMLDAAAMSFAVANAHPDVRRRASAVVPTNAEGGVVTTLTRLLESSHLT